MACDIICVGKIESDKNLADLFTKVLPTSTRYDLLLGLVWMRRDQLRDVEKLDSRLNREDCRLQNAIEVERER